MLEPLKLSALRLLHVSGYLLDAEERVPADFSTTRDYDCESLALIVYNLTDSYTGLVWTPFGFALKV